MILSIFARFEPNKWLEHYHPQVDFLVVTLLSHSLSFHPKWSMLHLVSPSKLVTWLLRTSDYIVLWIRQPKKAVSSFICEKKIFPFFCCSFFIFIRKLSLAPIVTPNDFEWINLLCVDDHILNSFLFLIYQQGVQVRESHASVKIMASVANVRLQRIWNKDWSKTKKQNNEKLSLRMADKLLSFNYNNSKCKRNTTQQKAQEMG